MSEHVKESNWGLWLLLIVAIAAIAAVSLWNRPKQLETRYGYVSSHLSRASINGAAAFREMYALRGWDTRTIRRLNPVAQRQDAIVWFPEWQQVPGIEATEWFDDWLMEAPRTLVFIARGFDSTERDYWRLTAAKAAPEDRLEYRRRQARQIANNNIMLDNTQAKTFSNGWFTWELRQTYSESKALTGPWTETIQPLPERRQTQAVIRAYRPSSDASLTAKSSESETVDLDTQLYDFKPLLTTADDEVLVARLTSDLWHENSQVLVLHSGEGLLNLSLLEPANRAFADHLVRQTGDPGDVGFLRTDYFGARVSGDSDDELAAGMELLTQWPLSMTTLHGVLLGFVTILVLLPIFGRPRRLPPPSTGDFGNHVAAVAELMQRTGDADYARQRISEYFVQVRGEDSGPWVRSAERTPSNPYHQASASSPPSDEQQSLPPKENPID
ncbi:MAG: hypothetical protein R3C05_03320 [Pirellulaceae bacterium]